RTPFTGCSTSPSQKTSRGCARATAPTTWPSSGTSPSTSSEAQTTDTASRHAANSPGGAKITSQPSSAHQPVNPDSLPCERRGVAGRGSSFSAAGGVGLLDDHAVVALQLLAELVPGLQRGVAAPGVVAAAL